MRAWVGGTSSTRSTHPGLGSARAPTVTGLLARPCNWTGGGPQDGWSYDPPAQAREPPQHALYSDTMALITSDYDIMRSPSIKWP